MSSPKVWFVTGASVGLGRSVVEHVLSKGDIAVATLRKPQVLSELSSKYDSSRLLIVKLDVTKPEEIKEAFAQAISKFGRVDVVYSNAGYGSLAEIEGTPDDVARGLFEVNFWGAANLAREAVRVFRDVNKPAGGRFIQASSMAGASAMPGIGYYSASKYAVEGITEALSKELKPDWNIKITILELGGYVTRGTDKESLVTIPLHSAYEGGPTTFVRGFLEGPMQGGDPAKAAREIRNIANDDSTPLRIALGLDARGVVQGQIDSLKADLEKSEPFSADLK
ncbi:hypothetical protein WG66_008718 [Moniliophthora roreri]|uniref:Putative NAD(P)-binding protein n=1 Tax=Moniliophthora roreri TaxID=221103 RepID=A0A0W0G8U5_MONRR|nr:hypothetical protein WG66_011128 [Moniliophthora roreri]KAI3604576.1 hypothetical protein WG66_008718 [Moniliophthora roreri]